MLPYESAMKVVPKWGPADGDPSSAAEASPNSEPSSDYQQQQRPVSSRAGSRPTTSQDRNNNNCSNHHPRSGSARRGSSANNNSVDARLPVVAAPPSSARSRNNIIPLRHQPVVIPPPPFAPKPWKAPKLQLAPGSESAKSRFMQNLESFSTEGSKRRERVAAGRKTAAAPGKWRSCANPQGYFRESEKPVEVKEKVVMTEKEREGVVGRLARVPPPRPPLPPIVAKWSMSEEEEEAMVERLSQPFERHDPDEPDRHVLDDEELDEMVQRLYRKPLDNILETRGIVPRDQQG